eukprot:scaffold110438_cov52-Attheya_sp.AAC.2
MYQFSVETDERGFSRTGLNVSGGLVGSREILRTKSVEGCRTNSLPHIQRTAERLEAPLTGCMRNHTRASEAVEERVSCVYRRTHDRSMWWWRGKCENRLKARLGYSGDSGGGGDFVARI